MLVKEQNIIIFIFVTVPSAPLDLKVHSVASKEIMLKWTQPATYTVITYSDPVPEPKEPPTQEPPIKKRQDTQADQPINDVMSPQDLSPEAISQEKLKDDYSSFWYKSDKDKYSEEYLPDLDGYRSKREMRSHRHRKRRQDANNTDMRNLNLESVGYIETHSSVFDLPIEVVKKSYTGSKQPKDMMYAYVLYYEQGVARFDTNNVTGVQSSDDVKRKNVFSSDLGMEEYSRATKNLTLLNVSGKMTKNVGFRLKNLSE